ncbi:hypothetical protein FRC12_013292 [Ceratobasidium sp. 428]|nr:hypothetical protein FRC12_013292 [Ceratobasidium sp. 428]
MQHNPSIQRLDLYVSRGIGGKNEDGESHFLAILPGDTFYHYIAAATSLRHLSGTCTWFEKEPLVILSHLPNLEQIDLKIDSAKTFDSATNSLLSDESFPSLRRFAIDTPFCNQTVLIMSTPRLVKRLTTLSLTFESRNLAIWDQFETPWTEMFGKLITHTPRLNSLELRIPSMRFLFPLNENMLKILAGLPLQTLILGGIVLEKDTEIRDLVTTLSGLTELRVLDQEVTLIQLNAFAEMPKLRHLELKLMFKAPELALNLPVSSAPIEVIECSKEGGEMCKKSEDVERIARNLRFYWPNLKQIEWNAYPDSRTMDMLDLLNDRLETLEHAEVLRENTELLQKTSGLRL